MFMPNYRCAASSLCLLALLSSCANAPQPPSVNNEQVLYYPPLSVIRPCLLPTFTANTWAELELNNQRLASSIARCAARLSAPRSLTQYQENTLIAEKNTRN